MHKYLTIASLSFMDRISMRGDVFLEILVGGARFLLALILWGAIFGTRTEIAGYSLPEMASYYLVASFVQMFDRSEGYVWEFSAEIRDGKFGKYLLRPAKPLGFFLSVCAGRTAFQVLASIAAACLWALPFAGRILPPKLLGLAASLPIIFLGLVAMSLINYMTAILAFAVPDILPYHMIKGTLIEFLSGSLIPLAVMPPWARDAIALTPFPALAGLPGELWLGRGLEELPGRILLLCVWVLVLIVMAEWAYRSLSARYEEAGS